MVMPSLLISLKKAVHASKHDAILRQRLIAQAVLLGRLKYIKNRVAVPDKAWHDADAFQKFMFSVLKPSRFAKGWTHRILHSFVLAMVLAHGDSKKLRAKAGAFLQKFEKRYDKLSAFFSKSPEFFAAYLSGLKLQKDAVTIGLLRCLASVR